MNTPPPCRPLDKVLAIPHLVRSISDSLTFSDLVICLRVNSDWHALFSFELDWRDRPQSLSVRDAFYITPWIYCELDARNPSKTPLTWHHIRRLLPRPWDYDQDEDLDNNHDNNGDNSETEKNDEIETEDAADLISCLYSDDDDNDDDDIHSGNGIDRDISLEDANDPTVKSMKIAQKLRDRLAYLPPLLRLKMLPGDDPRPHLQEPALAQILLNLPPTIQCLEIEVTDEVRDDDEIEQNSSFSFAHHLGGQRDHRALKSLQVQCGYLASSLSYLNWFLLRCCPNLKRLRLENMSLENMSHIRTGFNWHGHDEEPDLPTLEHCPNLSELEMEGPFNGSSVEKTMKSIKKLKILTLKSMRTRYGLQWLALKGSAATLESVTLQHTAIPSATLQAILVNCQGLQHLVIESAPGMPVKAWLNIKDLVESPWMCLGLKTLSLPLAESSISNRVDQSNGVDNESLERSRQLFVLKTYHQLSRLTALESLKICIFREQERAGIAFPSWDRSTIGLDFSIESGLDILSTLKRLKRLAFYADLPGQPFRPTFGQAEVEWLATLTLDHSLPQNSSWANWPELTEIELGTRPPAAVIEGQVRQETLSWTWLQEHRPDIIVSWASS